jgi:hypothetical protein
MGEVTYDSDLFLFLGVVGIAVGHRLEALLPQESPDPVSDDDRRGLRHQQAFLEYEHTSTRNLRVGMLLGALVVAGAWFAFISYPRASTGYHLRRLAVARAERVAENRPLPEAWLQSYRPHRWGVLPGAMATASREAYVGLIADIHPDPLLLRDAHATWLARIDPDRPGWAQVVAPPLARSRRVAEAMPILAAALQRNAFDWGAYLAYADVLDRAETYRDFGVLPHDAVWSRLTGSLEKRRDWKLTLAEAVMAVALDRASRRGPLSGTRLPPPPEEGWRAAAEAALHRLSDEAESAYPRGLRRDDRAVFNTRMLALITALDLKRR